MKLEQPTERGLAAHTAQIDKIIKFVHEQVGEATLVGVGIGSPGRFDADGLIKPGTNTNLEVTSGEFDRINLKEAYRAAMDESLKAIPLFVGNDGNAMLAGMLEAIQTGKSTGLTDQDGQEVSAYSLRRKHVALFGIGTGVGHAIAKVSDDGDFSFVTDGHASKLRVKVDDADWPLVTTAIARAGLSEVVHFDDHSVRAEDLFRGPIINAIAGVATGKEINLSDPNHATALQFAGKYMARTIALIKSGQSTDVEPANGWTETDKAEAAKTSIYLIGGGMGSSPLGKEIIKHARRELESSGLSDIQLVQVHDADPTRAAAAMVPKANYQALSISRH